jgi:5-methylthioadenosine/S-adenosylhomocysteine deaminase
MVFAMRENIAIMNGIVVTMNHKKQVLSPGFLLVQGDKILEISDSKKDIRCYTVDREIDARGKIVMPGMVNTHCHTRPMRGLGDGLSVKDMHTRYIDHVQELMTSEDAYVGARLVFAELIKYGITSVLNMSDFPKSDAKAAEDVGIRARLVPQLSTDEQVEEYTKELKKQHATADARVRLWLGLDHSNHKAETLAEVKGTARDFGLRIHMHVAKSGVIKRLNDLDFLGPQLILAHCVHVTIEEMHSMAENQVNVAHAPWSNMKLGSGIAPITQMLKMGINVSLGTDGTFSGDRLDILEEMRFAAFLQRVKALDASVLTASEALEMATLNGAKSLGMNGSIGSLDKGKKADITIVNAQKLSLTPFIAKGEFSNVIPLLVFTASGSDVETVLVDGKVTVD